MPGMNLKGDRKSFLRVEQSSHKGPSRPRITLLPTSRPHSKSCLGVPHVLSAQLFLSTKSLTQEYCPNLSWPSLHLHTPNSSPLEVQLKYYMLHTYTSHSGPTNSPSPFLHLPCLLSFAVHFANLPSQDRTALWGVLPYDSTHVLIHLQNSAGWDTVT